MMSGQEALRALDHSSSPYLQHQKTLYKTGLRMKVDGNEHSN